MGADLIAVAMMIEKDKTPDWDAAERHVLEMKLDEIARLDQIEPYLYDFEDEDGNLIDSEVRDWCLNAVRTTRDAYENRWRNTSVFPFKEYLIWIMGETSWGDVPPGWDEVCFFMDSGAMGAAGFVDD